MKTQDRGKQRLLAGMRRWMRERAEVQAYFFGEALTAEQRRERAETWDEKATQLEHAEEALYSIWLTSWGKTYNMPVFLVSETEVWSLQIDQMRNKAAVDVGHLVDVREEGQADGSEAGAGH